MSGCSNCALGLRLTDRRGGPGSSDARREPFLIWPRGLRRVGWCSGDAELASTARDDCTPSEARLYPGTYQDICPLIRLRSWFVSSGSRPDRCVGARWCRGSGLRAVGSLSKRAGEYNPTALDGRRVQRDGTDQVPVDCHNCSAKSADQQSDERPVMASLRRHHRRPARREPLGAAPPGGEELPNGRGKQRMIGLWPRSGRRR